jgi:hypothetical protein
LPGKSLGQQAPIVDPAQFKPTRLSPHVSIAPIDESILYNRRILKVGPNRDLKLPVLGK